MDVASSSSAIKTDTKRPHTTATGLFSPISDDLLHNILSRLPALTFASAACVSKSWNQICSRILNRPKLASALSLHPSPKVAVNEVIEKVLAEPIRPHFVVANIGSGFRLYDISKLISKKLGSSVPFIISTSSGIVGRDALTHEIKEVKWGEVCCDGSDEDCSIPAKDVNCGILLTVGFVPGLKVDVIPLLRTTKEPREVLLDKFITDIMDYTASVSDCTSPVGIMMFGDGLLDMKPIVDALDYTMPAETVIVGGERGRFLYRSENESRNVCGSAKYFTDAVALIFVKDKGKPHGIGDIQIQIALSNGVSTVGPRRKAVSVKVNECERSTWLTALKRALGALNTHIASNTYLVGHSVTLADIVVVCNLYVGFANVMTKSFTSEFPHVEKYCWTLVNQPNFKKVLGDVEQAVSVPPGASAKKPAQPAKGKIKEEPKKEAKKEPAKPKAEAAEEVEEAPKPKPKNPLDLLPPSKMVLDDWKRLYSNTKSNFREVAIKGFWDMYDPEGYSLWFCEYKYNDENTVSFVTLNKVGGFLQRMDLARKYAFGKMLVIGSEAPFKVKGLWLFRGQEIPKFVMDECYDMELYNWTKVDISDENQKERVNQMIEDQEPFEGEALLDAKCFK